MTIRRRLFISNILMIVIPIVLALMLAALVALLLWSKFDFKFSSSQDYYEARDSVMQAAEKMLENPDVQQSDAVDLIDPGRTEVGRRVEHDAADLLAAELRPVLLQQGRGTRDPRRREAVAGRHDRASARPGHLEVDAGRTELDRRSRVVREGPRVGTLSGGDGQDGKRNDQDQDHR